MKIKEIQNFGQWFDSQGYAPEHRDILEKAWDAGVDNAAEHFCEMEGTDYEVRERLQSSSTDSSGVRGGEGMYGKTPRITVGRFKICDNGEGDVWIEDESLDGASIGKNLLEPIIEAFFNKHF